MSASGISQLSQNQGEISSDKREQFRKTREAGLDAAAQLFNESPDDLKQELSAGKSLADVAKEKGVSTDDLQKAVSDAVKQANPNASDDQISNITQRMISGHHHHHHQQAPQAGGDAPAQSNLPPDSTISVVA